jgi:heat shock protein HslJ
MVRNLWPVLTLLAGCATAPPASPPPPQPSLIGPEWRLVHFQSSDDAIGRIAPADGEVYSLRFGADGRVAARLFCNRGSGSYTVADPASPRGSISFGPMAMTRAACAPTRLSRLPADLANVASYVIEDGELHLNLKIDGGDYVWAPAP